jgi:hypothetical protein
MTEPKQPTTDEEAQAREVEAYGARRLEDAERVAFETQIDRLRGKLRTAEAAKKILRSELELVERRTEILLTAREPQKIPEIQPRPRRSKNQAAAFMCAADWHVEERVDPRAVNFKNEYTPEIAEERGELFFVNGLRLVDKERKDAQIDVLVLPLLGDMITGHIHEDARESNWLSPTQATRQAQRMITSGLKYLLARSDCERILVPCLYGNHGRTTPDRRVSTAAQNSFEWLMYQTLADQFAEEKRLEFYVAESSQLYLPVFDLTVRITHGDEGFSYRGGVGGITIPLRKAVDAWDKFQPADLTLFAHYHQQSDYGSWATGAGSLIGANPYSLFRIRARYEPPLQPFFLIDAEHRRRTASLPIFVEKARR